jgi:hypothetical protein
MAADPAPLPPNLVMVRAAIRRLLDDGGVELAKVHDVYVGASAANMDAYLRAQYEWSCVAQTVREGRVTFRNGAGSVGGRRSIAGYREFLERREAAGFGNTSSGGLRHEG